MRERARISPLYSNGMADVLYFNGRFTTTDERVLGVEDRGFQFGDAIYEVFKFVAKRPVFMHEHFLRLERCLGDVEIANPFTFQSFEAISRELLDRTAFDDGIVYTQVSRGEAERAHFFPENLPPTVVMYTRRFAFPDAEKREHGIAVITTAELRSRLSYIKAVNLLPNALAKKKAQRAGAAEVLFVNDGRIVEGASSTFFAVKEGRVLTPALSSDLLPGVTRQLVVDLALRAGIPVEFASIEAAKLHDVDEAFITSTTQGVMPIVSAGGIPLGGGMRGPITAKLQELLIAAEARA